MTNVSVVTANICCLPQRKQPVVRARVIQALNLSGAQGAVMWQEIEIPRYHKAVRFQSAKRGRVAYGNTHEVPVSVPSSWQVLSSDVVKVHGGLAKISPARFITRVRCVVEGKRVTILACHPVSKPRWGVSRASWRISHHKQYVTVLSNMVAEEAKTATVVYGGDMNKTRLPRMHPNQVNLAHSGLDHIWVVPGPGAHVTPRKQKNLRRTRLMDHPLVHGSFDL